MRIGSILKPLTYAVAFLLNKLKVSIKFLLLLSYILALAVLGFFYLLVSSPYSVVFALALIFTIFINCFIDEVVGELVKLRKGGEYKILRNTDVLIIFGAIYYLGSGPYDFLEVYTNTQQNLLLGGAIVLGIVLVNYSHRRASSGTGLDTSSERMFLLGVFAAAGYFYNSFKGALFLALVALCALLYLSVLRDVWKIRGFSLAQLRSICSAIKYSPEVRPPKLRVKQPNVISYNFTAVVTEAKTEAPLSNATVTLIGKETGKKEVRYTDASGRGDFSVPEGQYKLVVEAKGFKKEEYERFINIDSGEVFKLSRPSVDLSVIVNDVQVATPISGASVILKIKEKEQIRRTDNLGVAYFDNLEPELCEVFVEAEGYEKETGSVDLEKENIISFNLSKI
ncbi:MAG: carboxypeptidase-like regulatory domain-containing protein [Candidatus Hydrothermarchaeota archaeon]|nr:carboxypeptidase-like regulatory domain-containing protein [Candidatus Hydrothermarchaeota archaeon]